MGKVTHDKVMFFRANSRMVAEAHETARASNMTVAEFCRAAVREKIKMEAA